METYRRRPTRAVRIGPVLVGGGAPVSIQSMNTAKTQDVSATLAQLHQLQAAGCQIGRLAVPDQPAAQALRQIVRESPLPLVADIHFDYRLALAAVEAGVAGLRLNPGNIGGPDRVRQVALAAKAAGIPIRIGVNGGSLDKHLLRQYGGITAEALCRSALDQAALLESYGFHAIKISLKCTDLPVMLAAYRKMAKETDYPLHVGVTEAGTRYRGALKNAIGIGALLSEGIGDTIRVSLTADPVEEVQVAKEILQMLGLASGGWDLVSCPTCGRTCIDLISLTQQVEAALSEITPKRRRKIAVMGCAVNGPGEASDADLGLAGGADGGLLFRYGQKVGYFPEKDLLPEFLRLAKLLAEEE